MAESPMSSSSSVDFEEVCLPDRIGWKLSKSSYGRKVAMTKEVCEAFRNALEMNFSEYAESVDCHARWEFKRLDQKGEGVIPVDTLFEGLRHRMSQDELSDLFDHMHTANGVVRLEEFLAAKMRCTSL
mmetsp:Transcript_13339/g.30706  ORF Transcript_13339/g.30706 Transcript_13339/m.30706 type:complete len:128 (-) Transcript_13339:108-491(-)